MKQSKICGIDEAGRGCIAGDLCVAGCILNANIDGIDDSKKLSEKKREILYEKIIQNSKYKIVTFNASQIDEFGLSKCLKIALETILKFFANNDCEFIYDGNCKFGVDGLKTIVKADAKLQSVGAASILAKVTRDRLMRQYAIKAPQYGFEKNKGYGSKAHLQAILKHGYTQFHRKSFKIKIFEKTLFDE